MKRYALLVIALLATLLSTSSCVSTRTRMLGPDEMTNVRVLGSVDTKFGSFHMFHIYSNSAIGDKAYGRLKREAQRRYPNYNVDVVNIRASGSMSGGSIVALLVFWPLLVLGSSQTVTATGVVITADNGATPVQREIPRPEPAMPVANPSVETRPQTASNASVALESAIKKAVSKLINEVPRGSAVAIVEMTADDWEVAAWITDELEFNFVSSKRFTVVDRNTLEVIRREQKLQASGAVSDETAVRIGALSGANVVIVGSLSKAGGANRLILKALNVESGQIITMARESY